METGQGVLVWKGPEPGTKAPDLTPAADGSRSPYVLAAKRARRPAGHWIEVLSRGNRAFAGY